MEFSILYTESFQSEDLTNLKDKLPPSFQENFKFLEEIKNNNQQRIKQFFSILFEMKNIFQVDLDESENKNQMTNQKIICCKSIEHTDSASDGKQSAQNNIKCKSNLHFEDSEKKQRLTKKETVSFNINKFLLKINNS